MTLSSEDNMTLIIHTDTTQDVINDFANEFYDAYELCEIKLVELENNPTNKDIINLIFRSIHSVKGNLSFVGLQPLLPLLQSIEDLLSKLRDGSLLFSVSLSDVILLSIDQTKSVIDELTGKRPSSLTTRLIDDIRESISKILDASPDELQPAINTAINTLAPETIVSQEDLPAEAPSQKPPLSKSHHLIKVLDRYNIVVNQDIELMMSLVLPFEQRSPFWHGKCVRQLLLTLGMNAFSGNKVNPTQLAAATLMHDFGMCFLPIDILHKTSEYSAKEKKQIQQHPRTAYELLTKLHHWDEAAEMVYQHHEHMNGLGYPHKLLDSEISDGAKIISIVDTFDAIMHDRAHIERVKRPFIRAILEINRYSDTQFSSEWVDIFNQFAQKLPPYSANKS